jgi:hypothetical protein
MKSTARLALLAGAVALCGLAVACSSGSKSGSPTAGSTLGPVTPIGTASTALQQYFQQVAALDETATRRLENISGLLQTPVPDELRLDVVRQYLTEDVAIDKDLRDGLQQLSPPAEARDAHKATIDALTGVIDIAQSAIDSTSNDPIGVVTGPQAKAASSKLADACTSLNRLAQTYAVSATLDCGQ